MRSTMVPLRRAGGAHGLKLLPVSIDGRGPFDFILDTGAHMPVLEPSLADELALRRDEREEAMGAGGEVVVEMGRVGQMSVGALGRRDVKVIVSSEIQRVAAAVRTPLRGCLGYGWLSAFRLRLDARAAQLQLQQGGPEPAGRVPFRLAREDRPLILLDLLVAGQPATFALDTGASATCISEPLARRLELRLESATSVTGGGGKTAAQVSHLPLLQAAGVRVENLRVVVAGFVEALAAKVEAAIDGVLGNDVLDEHVLVLDYPGSWLALE